MILNSPYISGSLTVTGNTNLIGALTVTGSLAGTATSSSFAFTASSAVSAYTAASAVNATTALTSSYATSFTVGGTLTAQTLVVQVITSSILYTSGSNRFGNALTDRQTFTGSMYVTGSTAYFAGNVGVGVALNNWATDDNAIQIGGNASIYSKSTAGSAKSFSLMQNAYDAAGGFTYISADLATRYNQVSGQHQWYTAPSAVAGAIMTFTQSMTLHTSSYLGLGTTTPSQKLHVYGTSDATKARIELVGTAGINEVLQLVNSANYSPNRGVKMGLYVNSGSNANQLGAEIGSAVSDVTNAYLFASTTHTGSTAERLRISSNGNLGIGTTNLSYARLSVYNNVNDATYGARIQGIFGNGDYQDSDATQNYGAGTSETQFLVGTTSRPAMISLGGDINAGEAVGVINFFRSTNSDTYRSRAWIWSGLNTTGTANQYGGFLAVSTAADGGTNPQERMRITSGGNVGIGTSSPSNILHASSSLPRIISDTSTRFAVFNLYHQGSEKGAFYLDNQNKQIIVESSGDNTYEIKFNTAGSERMRITSGGIVYALNGGVDGTYQPMIGGMYSSNNNETNLISTAVSSNAAQSGFRFDVSNGAGSSARTTSMTINRSSVTIVGSLSKGSGTFKINHPLESKKDTHHLVHSFIEGPRVDLIYRGKVTLVDGAATINIDESAGMTEGTFAALNRDIQCFTTNESGWDLVKGKVEGNILTITSNNSNSTDEISWMVIGERQDKHIKDTDWTDENGKPILEPLKTI